MFPAQYRSVSGFPKRFRTGGDVYELVPIRYEDRFAIMQWRNEQLYHLRQQQPLTEADQERYFTTVVANLFDEERPAQLLFSYLENGVCIGYGGLVHINYTDRHAEISFVMNTALERDHFAFHWKTWLGLLEQVAFGELGFHKVFTYAYDLRPHLFTALETAGYSREAVLKEHCLFEGRYIDVVIHSRIRRATQHEEALLRNATEADCRLLFEWANDPLTRQHAINTGAIPWDDHVRWFRGKLENPETALFILEDGGQPAGVVRVDTDPDGYGVISYSVDERFRGRGWGKWLIRRMLERFPERKFKAVVKPDNEPSLRIFDALGFRRESTTDALITFVRTHENS